MAESVLFCPPTLGRHPHLTRQAHSPSSLWVDRSPPTSPLPHDACSSKPLPIINEAMSELAAPLHLRAETFRRNERRLFVFHFSVFLFHLITGITTGFFSIAFHCKCIVFHLHLWAKEAFVDYPKNPIIIYNRQDFFGNGFWILSKWLTNGVF